MLSALRQSRFLILVLLLLGPGTAGPLVALGHQCPAMAPWAVAAHTDGGHHGGHGPRPAMPHPCQCVGACHGAAAVSGPAGTAPVQLQAVVVSTIGTPPAHHPPVVHLTDRLPPSTAPPAA